jgi:hypothetical protein
MSQPNNFPTLKEFHEGPPHNPTFLSYVGIPWYVLTAIGLFGLYFLLKPYPFMQEFESFFVYFTSVVSVLNVVYLSIGNRLKDARVEWRATAYVLPLLLCVCGTFLLIINERNSVIADQAQERVNSLATQQSANATSSAAIELEATQAKENDIQNIISTSTVSALETRVYSQIATSTMTAVENTCYLTPKFGISDLAIRERASSDSRLLRSLYFGEWVIATAHNGRNSEFSFDENLWWYVSAVRLSEIGIEVNPSGWVSNGFVDMRNADICVRLPSFPS